jgi:hypothetical protein
MRINRSLFAASLAAFATVPAAAADWRLMGVRPTHYGHSLTFVDADSIGGGQGMVQFTGFTYYSRQTRKLNKLEVVVRADCRDLTFKFLQITAFQNQRPLGQWHSTGTAQAQPGTNVFDQIRGACGYSELGVHIADLEAVAANHFRSLSKRRAARRVVAKISTV